MSYVFRKVKKYIINLLEMFAFNRYYTCISIVVLILTWTNLFGIATNLINSLITLSWIVGWLYEIHKLTKENEQLKLTNNVLTNYETIDVRKDLADLMHELWADDVIQTETITVEEQYRANTYYVDLSDEDKQVNLTKADRVLQLFNSYKNA